MTAKGTLIISLLLVVLGTCPAIREIWRKGYYPMHDDLQVMRQLEMDKCFKDGQIPCRWVSDMGYGYGYPLFNFYPPLPYYLGEIFVSLGISLITTVKIIYTLGFIVAAIGMFFLGKELWGETGGIISSLFYTYAPYHSTDIYVRGAMNEFWALAWYPFIVLGITRVIKKKTLREAIFLGFWTAMLMLSHNPMLMIFVPLAILWTIYWLVKEKAISQIKYLIFSGIFAFSLAAFFTLPVIFEQKYAHVETLIIGYFNYLAHYTDFKELFFRMNWGYGESVYGPNDTMSFNIGYLHWIIWGFVTLLSLGLYKRQKETARIVLFLSLLTLFYAFMTHSKSTEIWKLIKPLEFLQFPWRLLTIIIFGASLMAGSIVKFIPRRLCLSVVTLLCFAVVITNVGYFHWRDLWPWVNDDHKLSGELWRLQTTAGIFDYLPKWAPLPPPNPPNGDSQVTEGIGTSFTQIKKSQYQKLLVEIYSPNGILQLNTFYFPGWTYYIDGKKVNIDPKKDLDLEVGRPKFNLNNGSHVLEARFLSTPIRKIGNSLSLLSWILFLVYLGYQSLNTRYS